MAREKDDKAAEEPGADKPPDGDTGPAGRRPSHTIDLKAEEVEAEAAEDSAAEAQSEPDTEEEKTEEAAEAAKAKRREPPQRTTPGQVRGFVTHLAAGLMGGLIGVVGAGYALDRLGPIMAPAVETQQEKAGKLAAIEGRLARLEEGRSALEGLPAAIKDSAAQLEETTKALDGRLARVEEGQTAQQGFPAAMKERAARLEETSKALGDRLARVEETQAARADFPDTIKARLARLEETIKTLGAAAANGGDVAQTAAVAQQISDLSARLDTRLAALRRDVDALGARLDALPEPGADQSIAEDLARRVTALERKVAAQASAARTLPEDAARRLAELERKVGALAEREPAAGERLGGAALAVRFAALTRAIDEGAPFARELGALREIAPPGLDLSGLARQAQRGAPTVAVLARRFEGASRAALEAAGQPHADQSLIGQILTNARSLVRVRRIDGAAGDSPSAVLARMAAALKTGDLKAAVDESQKLPEPSREALGPWLDSARGRIDLEAARERIAEELGRRLAGGGSSGAREQAGGRQ